VQKSRFPQELFENKDAFPVVLHIDTSPGFMWRAPPTIPKSTNSGALREGAVVEKAGGQR